MVNSASFVLMMVSKIYVLLNCVCVCAFVVCADNNHVRTWTVTRFRGMISTQPGSTPLSSFKILSLDDIDGHAGCSAGTEIGKQLYKRERYPMLPLPQT